MKILYKQSESCNSGISNCYLKYIFVEKDLKSITMKVHHHTDFEVHIIEQGHQSYEIDGREYRINSGDFLIIPPHTKHQLTGSAPDTQKFSFTFSDNVKSPLLPLREFAYALSGTLPQQIMDNLRFIVAERKLNRVTSSQLIENRVLETIVLLFRAAGIKEQAADDATSSSDSRISIAKQYIADNVEQNFSVSDIAKYCYLSPKQLSRLFSQYEDVSLSDYIKTQRVEHVAALLLDDALSLKDISERMHFNNEYYFNSFVKKNLGQPPGTYRKMHK